MPLLRLDLPCLAAGRIGCLLLLALVARPAASAGKDPRLVDRRIHSSARLSSAVESTWTMSQCASPGADPRGQSPDDDAGEPDPAPSTDVAPDTDQKFPTDDDSPPQVPVGGAWSFLDPQLIGPDGTPGFRPWIMTFFAARTLPTFKADIKEPGPDSANFPNSAFTLPPGEVYIETSPITFQKTPFLTRQQTEETGQQITLPTLIRVGVFRDFELRLFSTTLQYAKDGTETTGFGPLLFDSKFHFWDQDKEKHIPAFGVQLMVQTDLGSPQFSVPQWEPQFSLNFDYELANGLELEWNIGGAWIVDETGARDYQGIFEWSIQRELVKNVDGFLHGYLIVPENTRFKEGAVLGGGAIWYVSNTIALDASYSFAIKPGSPDPIVRLGLSLAL